MIRFSKIFLILTIIILLAWQLPWLYSFFTTKSSYTPFTLYSCLAKDFISIDWDEETDVFSYDQSGNKYTRDETDSLLPFFYIRQLMSDSRVPQKVNDIDFNPRKVQMTNFTFRKASSEINVKTAELYPLIESMSGRVDLEYPDDVFRITKNGIEFIVMNTNSIDERKSELFTKTMKNKGFKFPAKCISGNNTIRKDYDEGFLIIDNEGELFHLKRILNRPYFKHITKPEDLDIEQVFITEFRDRKTLGYIIDKNNNLYVLNNKSYEIIKTGVDNYNPYEDVITIIGNMSDWTVKVESDTSDSYYALNAKDYSLIKSLIIPNNEEKLKRLHFVSYKDKYVKPRF